VNRGSQVFLWEYLYSLTVRSSFGICGPNPVERAWNRARERLFRRLPMSAGAPNGHCLSNAQRPSPLFPGFARLLLIVFTCTPFVVAPAPAAAQFQFGGFGHGGGLGALGMLHHGFTGGFGMGRGSPGFVRAKIQRRPGRRSSRPSPKRPRRVPPAGFPPRLRAALSRARFCLNCGKFRRRRLMPLPMRSRGASGCNASLHSLSI
jgi:hypothetical protein